MRTIDAQLHRQTETFVSYYDAGTGVYLAWSAPETRPGFSPMLDDPDRIHVISQDGRRTLGEIETSVKTVKAAAFIIRNLIDDPRKQYGETAGLWTAGY